ncbi:UNVERIFIED_CONTAM: hypothetical protein Sradi_5461300 [Sesamum radiatum]|uniref:Uncharacterized protein n=1 Tax=Sesamum radiatum TaxID=300843 RepID=A0AAW2LCC5_SESRA
MKVLRSREIVSTVSSTTSQPPKTSEPLASENVTVEPMTPSKSVEFLNQASNSSTPSSSSPAQNCGHVELGLGTVGGSVMVIGSGQMPRRSARLAKKVGTSDCLENVEVVSGKRKKLGLSSSSGECDVRNLERRVLDVMGVENSVEVPESSIVVTNGEAVKDGGSVATLGLSYEIEGSRVEALTTRRSKRKFSMEVKSLGFESHEKGEVEKVFLSLRSGKVVRRETKEDSGCGGKFLEGVENSKKSGVVLNGDVVLQTESAHKEENGHLKERRFTRAEKGKGKVGSETLVKNVSLPVSELDDGVTLSLGDSNSDGIGLLKSSDRKMVVKDKHSIIIETRLKTRQRLSKEEKGKMKLGVTDSSFNSINTAEPKTEYVNGSSPSGTVNSAANEALVDGVQVTDTDATANDARRRYRERFRNIARQNASRFAHFSSQEELGNHAPDAAERENPLPETDSGIEDWPGPFSTAMKIIKDREKNNKGERHGASTVKSDAVELKWIPKSQESRRCQKQVPSLQELCLLILSKNADAISSLEFVPDVLRHKICWFLCDSRRMDGHFLELLVHGSPTEIRIRDCSWLSEELFTKTFEGCNTSKLTVLQFDQCGGCMPDYTLYATLARSPNSLPALTTISLKGAYRLTDAGLSMLVTSAPSLKSVDISQCPLLTSEGICFLANSLSLVLRELYLDNCQGIDAMLILPAMLKLENLEVLSVAGISTVSDYFVSEFSSVHGCRMKELVLADCMELTDLSMKAIGDTCSDLHAVDLTNLCKLTDASIGHLANGCQAIQMLKFCRNIFSDEAIAAYLDVRGAFLKDLSLNNTIQVSNHTALSLARNCRNLRSLDLSWCRSLTNEALGLIVDSCSSLEVLKLFGCTQGEGYLFLMSSGVNASVHTGYVKGECLVARQYLSDVTRVFFDGHSNPQVKLIGLKMTPVLKHIDVPDFLLGPLRYSSTMH